jgi:hypothetical protein
VIRPSERQPNPLIALPTVQFLALLAYVDHEGNIEVRDGGFNGELIQGTAAVISEGALWVYENGDVVQLYPRGVSLLNSPKFIKPSPTNPRAAHMVVADFKSGILGTDRAMKYATARVLTDLEAFQGLVTLSDGALDHAIGSNLKGDVSVRQHHENIAELEALVRSGGDLAGEIRAFLEKIKDPRDKRKRHNVYRMVLIVRAVQRRAKEITEGKGNTLEAVTEIGLDVARYVGAVTATAAQIITELNDVQPWWTGNDGDLQHHVAEKRRKNFVARLRQYHTELLAVTAKPFRCWTFAAADRLHDLADWIETAQYANVLTDARYVVALMEAILVREGISRCITLTTRQESEDAKSDALDLLTAVSDWYAAYMHTLGILNRGQPMYDRLLQQIQRGTLWDMLDAAARETERRFDELLS